MLEFLYTIKATREAMLTEGPTAEEADAGRHARLTVSLPGRVSRQQNRGTLDGIGGLCGSDGGQFMDGSYGIRDSCRYSDPFRSSTLLQSKSGASVNTSSARAGSMIQLSAAISASSWPGPQPE